MWPFYGNHADLPKPQGLNSKLNPSQMDLPPFSGNHADLPKP
jgi:hypothetical protein